MLREGNFSEPKEVGDQFALLVSNVVDYAIFMLDENGRIITWNEGAQRIKGYTADEIIGKHFSIFYPPEEKASRKPDWELEVATREGRYQEEGWRVRKDGGRFWASVTITALRDTTGRLRGFGKVTRDLTEQHAQAEALNAQRDLEENRLRAHAERMAELEQSKTQFLNLASHELRGPLAVIRGYTSMLADGTIHAEQVPSVVRILEMKLVQMDRLVDQILATARLEHDVADSYNEVFDLGDVVREQVDVFRPLSNNHKVSLTRDPVPILVKGDRTRVTSVVANLIDNAIKYSGEGTEVDIAVGTRGSQQFVTVRDQGGGIAEEHMPLLFTRFGRLPTDANATIPGTGLGLFLCKEIALRHGGDITVASEPGAGAEFTLVLPAAP